MKFVKPLVKISHSLVIRVPKYQLDKDLIKEGDILEVTIKKVTK